MEYTDAQYHDASCVFCKIIAGEIPSEILYEDELVIAIKDVNPKAPVHILVIPKPHVRGVMELDATLASHALLAIQSLAHANGLNEKGFNVVANCGAAAGQTVFHAHFHLISGASLLI